MASETVIQKNLKITGFHFFFFSNFLITRLKATAGIEVHTSEFTLEAK